MKLRVYTDGASRGNPGEAGAGICIVDENGVEIEKRCEYLGVRTNNEAEYFGVYLGIKRAIELGSKDIELCTDSNLVIKQLSGEWKVKKDELKALYSDINELILKNGVRVIYAWIPRNQNKKADMLSNLAIDRALKN